MANIGQSCTEGRLGITGNNVTHSVASGITVRNITFSGSGPSDGIQLNGGVRGVHSAQATFLPES